MPLSQLKRRAVRQRQRQTCNLVTCFLQLYRHSLATWSFHECLSRLRYLVVRVTSCLVCRMDRSEASFLKKPETAKAATLLRAMRSDKIKNPRWRFRVGGKLHLLPLRRRNAPCEQPIAARFLVLKGYISQHTFVSQVFHSLLHRDDDDDDDDG